VSVRDYDGDAIQSVVFRVFDASTKAQITGSPFTATGPFPSGSSVELDLSGKLALGTRYEWDAYATDGILNGALSARESFVYAQVPTVTLAGPQTALRNAVRQPSAEYDPAGLSAYWSGPASRVADGDVPQIGRDYCWRVPYSGGLDPGVWRGGRHNVNAALPAHLSAWLRTELGAPRAHLRLACYDAAGARLGHVYPSSTRIGALSGASPDGAWKQYGGFVASAAWPAGTTQAAVEVLANSGTGADAGDGAVRFDLFFFVPNLAAGSSLSDSAWYGYFDGDTTGYGGAADYYWSGARGDSASVGLARLTEPAPTTALLVRYAGNAKADDAVSIERWTGSAWAVAYNPGFKGGGGARTIISTPSGAIQNHGRYRIRLAAKDANGLTGTTAWAEFDAEYAGPEELLITQVAGNDDEATISIGWQPSKLNPVAFAGIEVSLVEGEKSRTLDVLTDQAALGYVFHFPRTGAEYELRARQLALVEGEVVEGPWRGGPASVSYTKWHVKDIVEPGRYNASFTVYADMEPATSRKGSGTSFRPRHRALPVHYKGPQEQQSGSFEARILDGKNAQSELEELLAVLQRRYVALLSDRPPRVRYVYLGDPSESELTTPWYASVSCDWEESLHLEDYYAREGPR
ncbi:MAG: hypothetical protein M3Q49_20460, partial [Actinomycetota bacterium]|nr:hypothetical protein [Actinomycetota bacterium]